MAGGGTRPGRVLGSSDKLGAFPNTFPVDPADIQATIYHCLGLPVDRTMTDPQGRPMPLSTGTPILPLLA